MKEKLTKLLTEKQEQRKNLVNGIVEGETQEERKALNDTLAKLDAEIADIQGMIDDCDKRAEDGEGAEARKFSVIATMKGKTDGEEDGEKAAEARAQKFVETKRMAIDAGEARSVLLANTTKPVKVGGINEPFNVVSSIVDQIQIEDMTGMGGHKEAYMTAWQEASAKTDGTAQAESDAGFKTVAINPFLLAVTSYISREIAKQTPLQYEEKVKKGALIALKKKLADWIVNGNGSSNIFGIYNAANTDEVPLAMTTNLDLTGDIDATTLRKIVFAYGGDENVGGNARLYLDKKDLIAFGDVRGGSEKKAIYEIIPDGTNPNTGIIKEGGLSVPYTICSDMTDYASAIGSAETPVKTMVYGDPANYKLGLFGNFEVRVSEDYKFGEGLNTILGEVMVGGNVVVQNGFVIVRKSA